MEYFLMIVAILFASANSIILRLFQNRTLKTPGDVFFFNGGVSVLWALLLAPLALSAQGEFSLGLLLYGAVYALILFLFLYFKTEALASGPVALTTLIGAACFLIPTLYGLLVHREEVDLLQIVGMVLILPSLALCVFRTNKREKTSPRWFLFCFGFFGVGGLLGVFYKHFGASPFSGQVDRLMFTASLLSALLFFLFGLGLNQVKSCPPPAIRKGSLAFLLSSGAVGCLYIRMNISLSAVIPSAIFFPVSNGALVLLSTAAGYLFFREKLSLRQIIGLVLGLIAIVLTGCSSLILSLFA